MDIHWQAELSAADVWQRQAIIIEVQARGTGLSEFAHLTTAAPRIPGLDVIPLPEENVRYGKEDERDLKLRWKVIPHQTGAQQIELKEVHYTLNGGKQKSWRPPPLALDVKPLPPYLPPSFPVGKLSMSSNYDYDGWLSPGEIAILQLKIESDEVSQAQFPDVVRKISARPGLQVLPAKVNLQTTDNGRFVMDYSIPVKARTAGRLDMPEIQWQWFDPQSAKLQRQSYRIDRPWAMQLWQRALLGILLLFIFSVSGRRLYLAYSKTAQRTQSHEQLRLALKQQSRVREAMNAVAAAHGWPQNLGAREWLSRWQTSQGADAELEQALMRHEEQRFGK